MLETDLFPINTVSISKDHQNGDCAKKMLLVARQSDLDGAGGYGLLTKIMAAINYDVQKDCLLVSLPDGKEKYDLATLIKAYQIKDLIAFGVNPRDLNMNIAPKLYHPMHFEAYTFLLSHKVTEMDGNRDFKMKLWKNLQALYL